MTAGAAPGAAMSAEIAEQPAVLDRLLADATVREAAAHVRAAAPRFVLLAARGTSDHAALYAKYLVEARLGLPAGLVSPSSLTLYDARPDLTGCLFVAVSQSGSSPDLVESTTVARGCGALTVAVTNAPGSTLAEVAEVHVPVRAGVERAVAATKSYTAELLALRLLLLGPDDRLAVLPEYADGVLADRAFEDVAGRLRGVDRLITTGRGFSHPTAREAALKLMETSYRAAFAFSAADLLHGPLALLDPDVPVLAVVSPGRGGDATREILGRVRETGAPVVVVGPGGDRPVDLASPGAGVVPEDAMPVLEILPLLLLAWRLALDAGLDPDRPRGLAKVTRTR
jgi:glucosamine--fructose-6-phosphate aminotransferase (isomerizing)